jgi:hypothetical protein
VFSAVIGPGAPARRQRIAVKMAHELHACVDELSDETILALTSEITGALNKWAREDTEPARGEFGFDQEGALCWTPQALVRVLGFDTKTGLRRLKSWRQRGQGPRFIKLGAAPQSPVLYPVRSTLAWIERQDKRGGQSEGSAEAA